MAEALVEEMVEAEMVEGLVVDSVAVESVAVESVAVDSVMEMEACISSIGHRPPPRRLVHMLSVQCTNRQLSCT